MIIIGNFVHAPKDAGHIEYVIDGYIEVEEETGRILRVGDDGKELEKTEEKILRLDANEFLIPGFVDLHVHAPQFAFHGTGTDLPLMKWLETYTFPSEARMKDTERAISVYDTLIQRLLRNGTTTAMYFATQHLEATKKLVDICGKYGQRAFVGLVTQDINSPENYVEETSKALVNTERFILYCLGDAGRNGLVRPVITPRFVPTCSQKLLSGLGKLARKYDGKVWIQSHAAESRDEEEWVEKMKIVDEDGKTMRDTAIFRKHGLLGKRTVMAHCCWLRDDEMKIFSKYETSISHCPLSNFFFASKTLNLRRCERFKVSVGLGTDIAGGYASSILSSIRHAVTANRSMYDLKEDTIDFRHAFWLVRFWCDFPSIHTHDEHFPTQYRPQQAVRKH